MKPTTLIAAVGGLALLSGMAAGAVFYFKPGLIFAEATPDTAPPRRS